MTKYLSGASKNDNPAKSYAEAVKGVGGEIVEQESEMIKNMPAVTTPIQRSSEEIASMFDEMNDKERRKLNVVMHNLQEPEGLSYSEKAEQDSSRFKEIIKKGLKLMVNTTKTFRVGKVTDGKPRLLIVTLANMNDKLEILKAAASLRDSAWSNIFISPDLIWKEREKGRQLRNELAERKASGEEHIWIRHGRIVPIPHEKRRTVRSQADQPPLWEMKDMGIWQEEMKTDLSSGVLDNPLRSPRAND